MAAAPLQNAADASRRARPNSRATRPWYARRWALAALVLVLAALALGCVALWPAAASGQVPSAASGPRVAPRPNGTVAASPHPGGRAYWGREPLPANISAHDPQYRLDAKAAVDMYGSAPRGMGIEGADYWGNPLYRSKFGLNMCFANACVQALFCTRAVRGMVMGYPLPQAAYDYMASTGTLPDEMPDPETLAAVQHLYLEYVAERPGGEYRRGVSYLLTGDVYAKQHNLTLSHQHDSGELLNALLSSYRGVPTAEYKTQHGTMPPLDARFRFSTYEHKARLAGVAPASTVWLTQQCMADVPYAFEETELVLERLFAKEHAPKVEDIEWAPDWLRVNNCPNVNKATQKYTGVVQAPAVLFVWVKWEVNPENHDGGLTNPTPIVLEEGLQVPHYPHAMAEAAAGAPMAQWTRKTAEYRVDGVVYHIGSTIHGGHYVACTRKEGSSDVFYYCNDSRVTQISGSRDVFGAGARVSQAEDTHALVVVYTRVK